MSRSALAEIDFGVNTGVTGPVIRVLPNLHDSGLVDVAIANPNTLRIARSEGRLYDWTDARDMKNLTLEQLGEAIAREGVIFVYKEG